MLREGTEPEIARGSPAQSACAALALVALALAGCGDHRAEIDRHNELLHLNAQVARRVVPVRAEVIRVVDGDTVHLRIDGRDVPVRLLGIDTPETKKPNTPVQCGGPEATAYAHQRLDGLVVEAVGDYSQADADRYGRLLRYITLPDGSDYSVSITRAGWARSVTYGRKPVGKSMEISQAQYEARAAQRGIWGSCPMQ